MIDLVAKTNLKAKGQAFIVFDEPQAAERAIKEVQGFELFDKPMVLDYARTKSDATVLQEGHPDEFEAHKRRRLAEKGRFFYLIPAYARSTKLMLCLKSRTETSDRSC